MTDIKDGQKVYIVTGATGFLASYLIPRLLRDNCRLILLGRSNDKESLKDRVISSLTESVNLSRVDFIESDVQKDNLGLSDEMINDLKTKHITSIWHLAANLSFREKDAQDVLDVNINGTLKVIELATQLQCKIYYVSTSYISGRSSGVTYEKIYNHVNYNNTYERSKSVSEKNIIKWSKEKNLNYIIFRPSILIDRNKAVDSVFGYYSILSSLYSLKKMIDASKARNSILKIILSTNTDGITNIRLPFLCSNDRYINLMPVDLASDWMAKVANDQSGINKIYHITNPNPLLLSDVWSRSLHSVGLVPIIIKSPFRITNLYWSLLLTTLNSLSGLKRTGRIMRYYRWYMVNGAQYDMTNLSKIVGDSIMKYSKDELVPLDFIAKNHVAIISEQK